MGNRILVVDDEERVRQLYSKALTEIGGFHVESVETGEEALQRIEKEDFDLVLTDLKLPNMNGLQLINEIIHLKPEILTILVTGYASIDSALEAMKGGASDYFKKPMDLKEMVIRIEKALNERNRFVRLRELTDKLEKANQELKKLDEMKSEFVSRASHELRTPLTVMKSEVELILEGKVGKINKHQVKCLSMIKENTNRLIKIVQNLLDLSRIESGKIEMRMEKLEVPGLIDFILGLFKVEADKKSLRVKSEVPGDLPYVYADYEKIEAIMINLVGNAIKFTPEGGEISISTGIPNKGNEVTISVRDSGIGIPKDQLERVFEKFYQAENNLGLPSGGTGLGLAITKGLVEAHQGKIWAESEVGKGSVFTFSLPT